MLILKIYAKVKEYILHIGAIRWQISTCIKVTGCIFALDLTISEILTYKMFDLENLGQGHRVQHS